ncbi:AAA family ATPase [Cellulosimicrobium sp. RS]|uniref:AAA family ATPase n=1 Tax=Cellulosimicrobium sp. RS TaxID=3381347 RepID=UPI0038FC01B6
MTRLPVLKSVAVNDYALYPGTPTSPGLHTEFSAGLTLVIGANGLGKTTLITMLFRLLTGPFDMQVATAGGALGTRRIESRRLSTSEAQTFAARVVDGAKGATATLDFSIGDDNYSITRSLASLSLDSASKNGQPIEPTEESVQKEVILSAQVGSFGEWILLLRLLVFYFEDRRALVWDRTAQVQLLRLLFLSTTASNSWSEQFREIVELDSLVRNLTYVINKEERLIVKNEAAIGSLPELRQQLDLLSEIQQQEQALLESLNDQLVETTSERQNARLSALRAEQALETATRSLQRLELRILRDSFPDSTTTFEYIAAQILTDNVCLTCSSTVPEFSAMMRHRIHTGACPVCNSQFSTRAGASLSAGRLDEAKRDVATASVQMETAQARRERVEEDYGEILEKVASLSASTAIRDSEIGELIRRLPPDQASVQERRHGLNADKARLATHKERLGRLRDAFEATQAGVNRIIAESAGEVKHAFHGYASGFLLEDCGLAWTTFKDRVGESGVQIDFPAFELDMSGAGFQSPVRRSGPESVSESQREFIDLSFRMALMDVATASAGTLIIDAPESSLDAVFVDRASEVLTRFAKSAGDKRLVVTSNLIDGDLVPDLMARSGVTSSESRRVVDLLEIAAPTAATTQMHDAYLRVRERIFERAREKSDA